MTQSYHIPFGIIIFFSSCPGPALSSHLAPLPLHPSPPSIHPSQRTEGGCSLFSVCLWILPPPGVWHPQRWPNLGWPLGSGARRLCVASTVALVSVPFPLKKQEKNTIMRKRKKLQEALQYEGTV